MSKLISACLAGIVMAVLLTGAAAAQRFAYVDSERVIKNYKDWATAEQQFNTEYKAWEEEAARMETELQTMFDEYEKQKLILSADKKLEREAAISAKEQALNAFTRDISSPGGKAEKRMAELTRPLYEKITAAIEKVAIQENYDFVFNSVGLAYAKKELEITDKVIEVLESGE
jgi:outer membrane protein